MRCGEIERVRDHDERDAVRLVQLDEQIGEARGVGAIERAGRFVGEEQLRLD